MSIKNIEEHPSLAFFDMDGTLIQGLSQSRLLRFLYTKGIGNWVYIIIISAWSLLYKVGIAKNPESIFRLACRLTKGLSTVELDRLLSNFLKQALVHLLYPAMLSKLKWHQREGHNVVLITNAILPLAKIVGQHLGIQSVIGTDLEKKSEVYTGRVTGKVIFKEEKANQARRYIKINGYDSRFLYAYSDHVSDLQLLKMVNQPVVVNPCRDLKSIAIQSGWKKIECKPIQ